MIYYGLGGDLSPYGGLQLQHQKGTSQTKTSPAGQPNVPSAIDTKVNEQKGVETGPLNRPFQTGDVFQFCLNVEKHSLTISHERESKLPENTLNTLGKDGKPRHKMVFVEIASVHDLKAAKKEEPKDSEDSKKPKNYNSANSDPEPKSGYRAVIDLQAMARVRLLSSQAYCPKHDPHKGDGPNDHAL
jgi:hypothetical protein